MSTRRGNTIRIPSGYMTGSTLAAEVGVSADTIKRWRSGGLLPYTPMDAGRLTVYLFDAYSLQIAQQLAQGKESRLSERVA